MNNPVESKNSLKFNSSAFKPYFWTQALGAVNDNVFKNIVTLLFVYQGLSVSGMSAAMMANLCAGLFILPYVLFSGYAGVLAEGFDEARIIKWSKLAELAIMGLASIGFFFSSPTLLLVAIFLMGTQSTFYGPVKYSYLPSRLAKDDLTKANAWVEASTFMSILIGTIAAGVLVNGFGDAWVYSLSVLSLAAVGVFYAWKVPTVKQKASSILMPRFTDSISNMYRAAARTPSVYQSILGVSAFWLIGSIVLANLPSIAKDIFSLSPAALTWFLALFAVGVGAGSLLADKFSGRRLEIGLVPLASLGMAVALFQAWESVQMNQVYSFGFWLCLVGLFGGLYGVPLYALIQTRSRSEDVGKVISFLNFQNALFMVAGAVLCSAILAAGLSVETTLLAALAINVTTCCVIFKKIPEFGFRLAVLVIARIFYRIRSVNHEVIPEEGACLLVGNHVTWIDAFILSASCRRPPVYVMWWKLMNIPVLGWFLVNVCKAVPIAGRNENPEIYERAFQTISQALKDGKLCMIFPEGALTWDGEMAEFKAGVFKILEQQPCPLYAFGMSGAWGTFFSRKNLSLWSKTKEVMLRPEITVNFEKVPEGVSSPEELRGFVAGLIKS